MGKYFIDLKGVAYHLAADKTNEYQFSYFKFEKFDTFECALDYILNFVRSFQKNYELITLPKAIKYYNYTYTYSIYYAVNDTISEVDHRIMSTEVRRHV